MTLVGWLVVPVRGRLNLKTLANTCVHLHVHLHVHLRLAHCHWRNIRYEHESMHFTYPASSSSLPAAAGRTICVAAVALAAAAAAVAAAGPRLTTGGGEVPSNVRAKTPLRRAGGVGGFWVRCRSACVNPGGSGVAGGADCGGVGGTSTVTGSSIDSSIAIAGGASTAAAPVSAARWL